MYPESALEVSQVTETPTLLVPNTPITPTAAVKAQDNRSHTLFNADHSVPETPFTKTLSYFKQHNGADLAHYKPSRNTVIPQEIAAVATEATSIPESLFLRHIENTKDSFKDSTGGRVPSTGSAVDDLMFLQKDFGPPTPCEDLLFERFSQEEVGTDYQANKEHSVPSGAGPGSKPAVAVASKNDIGYVPDSTLDDAQKQIILYPQHPAFVNVIGMIPATMFWMTAAPVVKYTHIAIDMLIDKLRDTYL
jgi:hypothetical protein